MTKISNAVTIIPIEIENTTVATVASTGYINYVANLLL